MLKKLIFAVAVGMLGYTITPSQAQQLIESYVALLSDADHFNSKGERLTSAAAIIRQDRANFHRFGIRDPEDEDDSLFADEGNRAALEQMLDRGRADPDVISRIVNGTVLVRVDVYRNTNGPFIRVTLLDKHPSEAVIQKPESTERPDTSQAIAEIKRILGDVLLPVTENPDDWMLRVAAVPVQEQQFCRIIDRFYSDLADASKAQNEIKKNVLYRERLQDLATLLPHGAFENWVVRVKEVTQAPDGSAAVVLQPPCRAMLGSDACRREGAPIRATIKPDSTMFRELAKLSSGDFVIVNGTILYAQSADPNRPLPTYALYEPGSYCSAVEGGAQQDVFVTEIQYLVGIR